MSRIADTLEHESQAVDLEPGDFERLLGRRERRHRNRRIRAGALGVIVALAMGLVFLKSVSSNGTPADRPEPRPARAVVSGALAYVLGDDIWVADPDGSNAFAFTDGAIDEGCPGLNAYRVPSWSPDGRYLALRRLWQCSGPNRRQRGGDVVIADLQGNVLADFPGQGSEVAWSPDSTRVAVWDEYSWNENGVGTYTIGVYGIDGTRQMQIAMPPGWEPSDRDPIWTPDGASLIVNRLEVPLDGGTPRELPFPELFRASSGAWWSAPLAYSPDGSQVAYGTRNAMMVARSDGSEPREVLGDAPVTATWSPTGELIAVTSDAPGAVWGPNQLSVVDVATGSSTPLFRGEPGAWLNVIGFSPAGDRVLFCDPGPPSVTNGINTASLWSVGVDASDARQEVMLTCDGAVRPT